MEFGCLMKNRNMKKVPFTHFPSSLETILEKEYGVEIPENYFQYIERKFFFDVTEFLENLKEVIALVNEVFLYAYRYYFEKKETILGGKYALLARYLDACVNQYFLGRYDCLIDRNGVCKIIEFNANTPWLITELYKISSLVQEPGWHSFTEMFRSLVWKTFSSYQESCFWILLAHSFSDEDFLIACDYYEVLSSCIPKENIIIGDIFESQLVDDHGFYIKWRKIDVLVNFFPLEFFLTDTSFAKHFFDLVKQKKILIINPLESIVFQDKKFFALLYEHIELFPKKYQKAIRTYIPYTTSVFQNNPNFLAKHRFSRMSRWVCEVSAFSWYEQREDFVFQEKVFSLPCDDEGNICVFGIFTNLQEIVGVIARKQKEFITNEHTEKIVCCFFQKQSK